MPPLFLRTKVRICRRIVSFFKHSFEAVYFSSSEGNNANATFSFKYGLCPFTVGLHIFFEANVSLGRVDRCVDRIG
jgi:hypothetical protein